MQDTFESITNKVNALDNRAYKRKDLTHAILAALGFIIPFRKVQSVPDKIENNDYTGATLAVGAAAFTLPEDWNDTKAAFNQIFKGVLPKYDYKEGQVPFSTIRGSYAEDPVNKLGGKLGHLIHKWDKTLFDTKFGQKIKVWLKVEDAGREPTGRTIWKVIKDEGKYIPEEFEVYARKYKGPAIGKFGCRALNRMTVYGTLILSVICLPSIVRALNKPRNTKDKVINGGKQTLKSAISVISTISGIGLMGALLAPLGPAGSVAGMAIGAFASAYISNKINKNIKTK